METRILDIHRITTLADHAQHNYSFYKKVLGLLKGSRNGKILY
jgi:hypothetical protein